jgi:hypothetical protein
MVNKCGLVIGTNIYLPIINTNFSSIHQSNGNFLVYTSQVFIFIFIYLFIYLFIYGKFLRVGGGL